MMIGHLSLPLQTYVRLVLRSKDDILVVRGTYIYSGIYIFIIYIILTVSIISMTLFV